MMRDFTCNYQHEAHLDDNLDLESPEIKIIKKEFLDQIEGFMDFSPLKNGVNPQVNDRLGPADM